MVFTKIFKFKKRRYFNVRNDAWQFLIKNNITELPINVFKIAQQNGWILKPAAELGHKINNDAEYFYDFPVPIILYKNTTNKLRLNFSIAHEFGHAYIKNQKLPVKLSERESNMFAARILAPMCVLQACNVSTPDEISKLCGISLPAAQFRFRRLQLLRRRKMFLTNQLEINVYNNFKNFIDDYLRKK